MAQGTNTPNQKQTPHFKGGDHNAKCKLPPSKETLNKATRNETGEIFPSHTLQYPTTTYEAEFAMRGNSFGKPLKQKPHI